MAIKSLKGLLSFSFSSLSTSSASSSSGVLKRPIYKQKLSVSKLGEAAAGIRKGSLLHQTSTKDGKYYLKGQKVLLVKETEKGPSLEKIGTQRR